MHEVDQRGVLHVAGTQHVLLQQLVHRRHLSHVLVIETLSAGGGGGITEVRTW